MHAHSEMMTLDTKTASRPKGVSLDTETISGGFRFTPQKHTRTLLEVFRLALLKLVNQIARLVF